MTLPTIHRNGTAKDDLLEGYMEASSAIQAAIRRVEFNGPNGRDYYPQGDGAIALAIADHVWRISRLVDVRREIEEIMEHISKA